MSNIVERQVREAEANCKEWVCLACGAAFDTEDIGPGMMAAMGGNIGFLRCISCNSLRLLEPGRILDVLESVERDGSAKDFDAPPPGGFIKPKKP